MSLNDIVVLRIPSDKKGAFLVDEETGRNYLIYKSRDNEREHLVLTDMTSMEVKLL